MTAPSDTVCVGVSGGADSVCLLLLLKELCEELRISVTAFHVNHCLRGSDSDADQDYVRELCASLNVPLREYSYDIKSIAAANKEGLEEAGRRMRREAAEKSACFYSASKIALAHHANDNAETVLFNMARGSSAGGLKGILPVNGNIIRPLLCLERKEIENWLKERGVEWREDITNKETDYSRNMLRNVIIPALEKNINSGAIRHINAAASDMAEAALIVDGIAKDRLARYSERRGDGVLLKNGIMTEYSLVNGAIALMAMESVSGASKDLERIHAFSVVKLFGKQVGRLVGLPYKMSAERVYGGVLIRKNTPEETREFGEAELMPDTEILYEGLKIKTKLTDVSAVPEKIPKKQYTKWFDYDKIYGHGLFRAGRPGDHIVINSAGGRKKFGKYLTDEKVPREKRKSVICLVSENAPGEDSEILWVVGMRIGETAKVTPETKRVLEISIT